MTGKREGRREGGGREREREERKEGRKKRERRKEEKKEGRKERKNWKFVLAPLLPKWKVASLDGGSNMAALDLCSYLGKNDLLLHPTVAL
jgi:hypothetical protein